MTKNGVLLNARLDAAFVVENKFGVTNSGGMALVLAGTAESRANIPVRRRQIASQILWALEESSNLEPLPRTCFAVDVFSGEIVCAPTEATRHRENVEESCLEVAQRWPDVTPPQDYDGSTPH